MITLTGPSIYLRALEPEDLDFIYRVENDEEIWQVSNTQAPFSRFLIKQYLENTHKDIYEAKQVRLAICRDKNFPALGLIDLFDFDPKNRRAGVGIIVSEKEQRNKGIGSEALDLIIKYAFSQLNLHQLYANIDIANKPSITLFSNAGFINIGTKKDWNFHNGKFYDELLFQLINKN